MLKKSLTKNILGLAILSIVILMAIGYYADNSSDQQYCPIMAIELHGDLTTYAIEDINDTDYSSADYITWAIRDADSNDDVSAILLEVDSYGGSGVAGDEIATALKEASKPTAVLVRNSAVSASYWATTGADYIVASVISDTGGIGVTASYLDNTLKNSQEGLTYIDLSSAKFKNMGDPNKPLTIEERALWQRDLEIMHQHFIEQVAINRGLEIENVRNLADGSTILGQMALENGLIDKIGGRKEVIEYLIDKGVIDEDQEFCWY